MLECKLILLKFISILEKSCFGWNSHCSTKLINTRVFIRNKYFTFNLMNKNSKFFELDLSKITMYFITFEPLIVFCIKINLFNLGKWQKSVWKLTSFHSTFNPFYFTLFFCPKIAEILRKAILILHFDHFEQNGVRIQLLSQI